MHYGNGIDSKTVLRVPTTSILSSNLSYDILNGMYRMNNLALIAINMSYLKPISDKYTVAGITCRIAVAWRAYIVGTLQYVDNQANFAGAPVELHKLRNLMAVH